MERPYKLAANDVDIRSEMGVAVLQAIVNVNERATGSTAIEPAAAYDALMLALASVLEANSELSTSDAIAQATHSVAKDLQVRIESIRDHAERTGQHPFRIRPVRLQ